MPSDADVTKIEEADATLKASEVRRRKALARIAVADRKYRAYLKGART